ncbi:MAG: hypothetical protein ACJASL_003540 [Paraglaciecola sp.]|jgi:hypothetical protein
MWSILKYSDTDSEVWLTMHACNTYLVLAYAKLSTQPNTFEVACNISHQQ